MTVEQVEWRLRRLAVLLVTQFAFVAGQVSLLLYDPALQPKVVISTVVFTMAVAVVVLLLGAAAERERQRLDRLAALYPPPAGPPPGTPQ